jgi:hypothetical protein
VKDGSDGSKAVSSVSEIDVEILTAVMCTLEVSFINNLFLQLDIACD